MAERKKDAVDLRLEALFRAEPVPDDGFSQRVMARVRRGIWVRRLALPVGISIGGLAGAGPLIDSLRMLYGLLGSIDGSLVDHPLRVDLSLPAVSTVLLGAALLLAAFIATRMLEE